MRLVIVTSLFSSGGVSDSGYRSQLMLTCVHYLSEVVLKFKTQRRSRAVENVGKFHSYFLFIATNNEKYSVLTQVQFYVCRDFSFRVIYLSSYV